jgi:sulfate transport system substrate-binding protein
VKAGLEVITPNPNTSGGARWNYLAAWAFAAEKFNGDEARIRTFMKKLFLNVPVLDTGARGSTTTFVQRQIGDVLLAWENEAFLAINELGPEQFEIVVPSISILAEPPVAVVDANARKKGLLEAAQAYLEFLYTPEAQLIIGKHHYRPTDPAAAARFADQFPEVRLVTIDDSFGGWQKAQARHFNDGGTFDEIYAR